MGDSFAFGEQVDNRDTFASKMQESLGSEYRVLNFGVPGFGVDQSYLRYVHHAMPWQPDVAVLTFIWHDLFRTLSVYTAIAFPHWDLPFSKPRFVLTDAGLEELNTPTAKPDEIFATPRIQDLPLVDQALGYEEVEWREGWRRYPLYRALRADAARAASGSTLPSAAPHTVARAERARRAGLRAQSRHSRGIRCARARGRHAAADRVSAEPKRVSLGEIGRPRSSLRAQASRSSTPRRVSRI